MTRPKYDLIRRMDAMQACQVGPSDEWSKATKAGYNQAATDCAMALLKCEPVPPTLSAALELPEVRALVEALENIGHMGFDMPATLDLTDDAWRRRRTSLMQQSARNALAAIKEPKI